MADWCSVSSSRKFVLKKALITGVFGQDGCFLSKHLSMLGYQVYGASHNPNHKRALWLKSELPNLKLVKLDITDVNKVEKLIDEIKPDEIYNLASLSSVKDSWNNPEMYNLVNFGGILNILKASTKHQDRFKRNLKIYQASSSEIFGYAAQSPQDEETPFLPTSPYGKSKHLGHLEALDFRNNLGMFVGVGIMFNHESNLREPSFVTRKISLGVAKIHLGLSTHIELGNLNFSRDWGYAGDFVGAMHRILQYDKPETFVIATGISSTVAEIAEIAFNFIGISDWKDYISHDNCEVRPADSKNLIGNSNKAKRLLSWKSKMKINELMETMTHADILMLKSNK
jgi:GDPmannose 4,6-dehydratase